MQFIKAHLIIASLSHLIQETKDISSGHDEHLIEHFLQINFLHILQNKEQFIHISFLHKLLSQILIQEKSVLILHKEQLLFELIKLLFFVLCFKQLSLFSFPHKVMEHFLQTLAQEEHIILLHTSHIVSDLFLLQSSHLYEHFEQMIYLYLFLLHKEQKGKLHL